MSLGMQSADDGELRALGRRHAFEQTARAAADARAAGVGSLSLDLMLATPGQTADSLVASAAAAAELGVGHVSAYLLKIEEGTPYFDRRDTLDLPDEDEAAERYLIACASLEAFGYRQYEISNFARPGDESRHNLKYWQGDEYLGIGPAAHSFMGGRRFYYPRDLRAFLDGAGPAAEAEEGQDAALLENGESEYLMLRLRLTEGVTEAGFAARFGHPLPQLWRERAAKLPAELIVSDGGGIRLTRSGFLLSNVLIGKVLGF